MAVLKPINIITLITHNPPMGGSHSTQIEYTQNSTGPPRPTGVRGCTSGKRGTNTIVSNWVAKCENYVIQIEQYFSQYYISP